MKKVYLLKALDGTVIVSKAANRAQAENSARKILMNFGVTVQIIEK